MLFLTLNQQSQVSTPTIDQLSEIQDTITARLPTYNDSNYSSYWLTPLGNENINEEYLIIRQEQTYIPK